MLRIAAAILVESLAFVVWNLAARSPVRLARDVIAGLRRPVTLARGLVSFVVGLVLLVGSVSLLVPLYLPSNVLAILITWTVVTALLVEQIVGPSLYERLRRPER